MAEDSEDDAFLFQHTFRKSKVSCGLHCVTNGADAMEFLKSAAAAGSPGETVVVFLDLKMPVVNGFEVLEWLRTQEFPFDVEVIVLSGSEQEQDKERAARLGATEYVVKPIRAEKLRQILEPVCSSAGAHA
ncbi:MAG TPA: response regulator [Verrucomicrobiae bacterium]|nr:response regulator [Verrucomicrobiae bacterium]